MTLSLQLLIIQHITIVGLFVECWIIFNRMRISLHTYLGLSTIASLIINIGYLLELTSDTEAGYLAALKFSYLGRVWYAFFLILFIAEFVRVKIPNIIKGAFVMIQALIYVSIVNLQNHELFYYDIHFVKDGLFPVLVHENGILHDLNMVLQIIYIVIGMVLLIRGFIINKTIYMRRRILIVIAAVIVESMFFIIQMFGLLNITKSYDVTMLGYFFGTIIIMIAIFKFDLLGTREIAREFIIDRISEGIIVVDNDGNIQYSNDPAISIFPVLKNNEKSDKKDEVLKTIKESAQNGSTLVINDRIYTTEENNLLYKKEVVGKLYALADDTEHFKYMDELKEQRELADSANAAKSRFLANMSHEIRTPINAVLGMDEMILRESREKNTRTYAADIMSAGRTLLSLINDILDFSKVEEGRMEIIPVQYDLSNLINDLSNLISDRAKKKGLEFTINANENIPNILYGDEIRIRQCVTNLLTNAVKYTETGSVHMEVTYEPLYDKHIRLGFAISDTGIGMRSEDMEKLFTPYKRIEEKRNRMIEGTGLGMSITRQLLELMGSKLDVVSDYGKGSVFSFKIEQEVLSDDKIGDLSKRLNDPTKNLVEYRELFHAPDARILVVDDTQMNLTVITNLLKETKIRIDTASSGREAVNLALENEYDVIFIDHMMPDMDGIETLEKIRSSGKNTKTPSIALTANAISGARQYYLDAGFDDYLSKPIDSSKLEKMLYDMIPDEKIMEADNDDGSSDEIELYDDDRSDDVQWLYDISEINVDTGIANCGSMDNYLSALTIFKQTAANKADEIEQLWHSKDIENYTIKVHALKSTARIIGAEELSELALSLEMAGKEGNTEKIDNETDKLLEKFRYLVSQLKDVDESQSERDCLDKDSLKEAYQAINEIAQSMDYDTVESIIVQVKSYKLNDDDKSKIQALEKALYDLNWDEVIRLTETI